MSALLWSYLGMIAYVSLLLLAGASLTHARRKASAARAKTWTAGIQRVHAHGELSKLEPVNLELTGEHVADFCPACGKTFYRPGW